MTTAACFYKIEQHTQAICEILDENVGNEDPWLFLAPHLRDVAMSLASLQGIDFSSMVAPEVPFLNNGNFEEEEEAEESNRNAAILVESDDERDKEIFPPASRASAHDSSNTVPYSFYSNLWTILTRFPISVGERGSLWYPSLAVQRHAATLCLNLLNVLPLTAPSASSESVAAAMEHGGNDNEGQQQDDDGHSTPTSIRLSVTQFHLLLHRITQQEHNPRADESLAGFVSDLCYTMEETGREYLLRTVPLDLALTLLCRCLPMAVDELDMLLHGSVPIPHQERQLWMKRRNFVGLILEHLAFLSSERDIGLSLLAWLREAFGGTMEPVEQRQAAVPDAVCITQSSSSQSSLFTRSVEVPPQNSQGMVQQFEDPNEAVCVLSNNLLTYLTMLVKHAHQALDNANMDVVRTTEAIREKQQQGRHYDDQNPAPALQKKQEEMALWEETMKTVDNNWFSQVMLAAQTLMSLKTWKLGEVDQGDLRVSLWKKMTNSLLEIPISVQQQFSSPVLCLFTLAEVALAPMIEMAMTEHADDSPTTHRPWDTETSNALVVTLLRLLPCANLLLEPPCHVLNAVAHQLSALPQNGEVNRMVQVVALRLITSCSSSNRRTSLNAASIYDTEDNQQGARHELAVQLWSTWKHTRKTYGVDNLDDFDKHFIREMERWIPDES